MSYKVEVEDQLGDAVVITRFEEYEDFMAWSEKVSAIASPVSKVIMDDKHFLQGKD